MLITPTSPSLLATSGTSSPPISSSSSAAAAAPTQTLGINDFMKLLATQFEEQDPLQPMDDTAFIAQTAQFTALQQSTTLTQQVTQMAANDYIGRQVAVNSTNGQTTIGTVTAIDTSGATPNLIINGAEYPLSGVVGITTPPVAATTTTPSTTTPSTPLVTAPSTAASPN
jgi:flagellar basal-body rod modification protein FlgD